MMALLSILKIFAPVILSSVSPGKLSEGHLLFSSSEWKSTPQVRMIHDLHLNANISIIIIYNNNQIIYCGCFLWIMSFSSEISFCSCVSGFEKMAVRCWSKCWVKGFVSPWATWAPFFPFYRSSSLSPPLSPYGLGGLWSFKMPCLEIDFFVLSSSCLPIVLEASAMCSLKMFSWGSRSPFSDYLSFEGNDPMVLMLKSSPLSYSWRKGLLRRRLSFWLLRFSCP